MLIYLCEMYEHEVMQSCSIHNSGLTPLGNQAPLVKSDRPHRGYHACFRIDSACSHKQKQREPRGRSNPFAGRACLLEIAVAGHILQVY